MKNFDKTNRFSVKAVHYNGDTRIIRDLTERMGLIKKHRTPEKCSCPVCGKKTIYTWRHVVHTNIFMAFECYYCDFNALNTGTPINCINEVLKELKKESMD